MGRALHTRSVRAKAATSEGRIRARAPRLAWSFPLLQGRRRPVGVRRQIEAALVRLDRDGGTRPALEELGDVGRDALHLGRGRSAVAVATGEVVTNVVGDAQRLEDLDGGEGRLVSGFVTQPDV